MFTGLGSATRAVSNYRYSPYCCSFASCLETEASSSRVSKQLLGYCSGLRQRFRDFLRVLRA